MTTKETIEAKLAHIYDCASVWQDTGAYRAVAIKRTVQELRAIIEQEHALTLAGHALVQVGGIHKSHLEQRNEPWCKEILLYSPTNSGDSPGSRVMLYAVAPA